MGYRDGFHSSVIATKYTAFSGRMLPELALYGIIDDERIAVLGGLLRPENPGQAARLGMVVLRNPQGDCTTYDDRVPRTSVINCASCEWGPGRALWLSDQGGRMPYGTLAIHAGHTVFKQIFPAGGTRVHDFVPVEPPSELAAVGLDVARFNDPCEELLGSILLDDRLLQDVVQ
ncbi:MAG TPA: hypothetical protein VLH86_06255 [Patescibacteria group bacterium]|nr:hypothetical protein [Patescibacteria group bacterium]